MRRSSEKRSGLKQTVSLTLDRDVYRQAKELGMNVSKVAEAALVGEVRRCRAEQLASEIGRDLEAANAYVERHGAFAELAREQFSADDAAVSRLRQSGRARTRGVPLRRGSAG